MSVFSVGFNLKSVKIISDLVQAELEIKDFLSDSNPLSSFLIKKKVNDAYKPDDIIVFKSCNSIIPIVVKDNLATFYGGQMPFNDYNAIKDFKLLDFVLNFFQNKKLDFRLLSIENDYANYISKKNLSFDVPYNQRWVFKNVKKFQTNDLICRLSRKRRNKTRRALSKIKDSKLVFKNLDKSSYSLRKDILEKSIINFNARGKENIWSKYENLYVDLLNTLIEELNSLVRILYEDEEMVGYYVLTPGKNSLFLPFSNSFETENDEVTSCLYFDALEKSSILASDKNFVELDAGRGSFTYKKRFKFEPVSYYALVSDSSWNIKRDLDLSASETLDLYGRDFGCYERS